MRRLVLLLPALALVACTADSAPSPGSTVREPPVALSFSQHRVDENTPVANLRVINLDEQRPVEVVAVGVDWPGYGGEHVEANEATVMAGQTLDLRMTLPEPACGQGAASTPAYGVIQTADGATVRARLEEAGQGFLASLWSRACNLAAVDAVASLRVGDRWRVSGRGGDAAFVGSIDVERTGSPDARLTVPNLEGSILFDLTAGRPRVLRPGQERLDIPVRLTPFRCDPHARGETTQAFLFRLDIAIDDAPSHRISLTGDDPRWQVRAMDYLDDACG